MLCKENLIKELKKNIAQSDRTYDEAVIDKAVDYAITAHTGQFRSSGEEYVCHPIQVALILVQMGMDTETIVAALLHDVVEDTDATLADLTHEFGANVALLVDGVTKIDKLAFSTKEEQQAENFRKMLLALSKDVRVIIIKLADRLHNMRTIGAVPEQKRRDKAKETMDIYAPIAHRLGMEEIKEELEDISIRTLDPVAYDEIEETMKLQKTVRDAFLDRIKDAITDRLTEYGLTATVTGRTKSIASSYRKMYLLGKTMDEIYDVYAVRIIVDEVNDCYNALGLVHEMFRPIPGRFKDYISSPKPNMYQSLHTTVIGTDGIPFEVQIRTWKMHYTAEYGIAAHWKYKAGIRGDDQFDERLKWVRQFIENQNEIEDADEAIRTIRTDLTSDEIFALTPKGDVISLPTGATVIDFAYAIHSAVGNRMIGAKADGRIVPLDYRVKTGQIIEVMTSPNEDHGPSRDWLNVVQTGEARTKIRTWFKRERRDENIAHGKAELERELSRNLIRLPEDQIQSLLEAEAKRQHCNTVEDLYAAIGYGGVLLSKFVPRLKEEYLRILRESETLTPEQVVSTAPKKTNNGGVVIEGVDNCLVKFSRCCNPLPGDDIIGFITRGNGVSIHKQDCVNVTVEKEPDRWVNCHWEDSVRSDFKATFYIDAYDRPDLLSDVLAQLSSMHIALHSVSAREADNDMAVIEATIAANSVDQLNMVLARVARVPSVISVKR